MLRGLASGAPAALLRRCWAAAHASSTSGQQQRLLAAKAAPEQQQQENELDEFRRMVREFAQEKIAEKMAAKIDHDNDMPLHLWTDLGSFGLLGEAESQKLAHSDNPS